MKYSEFAVFDVSSVHTPGFVFNAKFPTYWRHLLFYPSGGCRHITFGRGFLKNP